MGFRQAKGISNINKEQEAQKQESEVSVQPTVATSDTPITVTIIPEIKTSEEQIVANEPKEKGDTKKKIPVKKKATKVKKPKT